MILDGIDVTFIKESEFVNLVSRGKLAYPNEELFDLSLYLYSYYKSVEDKRCVNKIISAFHKILQFTQYEMDNSNSVLRRFANCFSKAFALKVTDKIKVDIIRRLQRNSVYQAIDEHDLQTHI